MIYATLFGLLACALVICFGAETIADAILGKEKSWNVTATERETLVQNIVKMDKHFRTWTVRCFNINARAVNEINNRAKAQGAKRGQRVEIQL